MLTNHDLRRRRLKTALCLLVAAWMLGQGGRLPAAEATSSEITMRARLVSMQPDDYVRIHWRYGDEGLSGRRVSGEFTAVAVSAPQPEVTTAPEENPEIIIGKGCQWLRSGVWSPAVPLSALGPKASRGRLFLTVTMQGKKTSTLRDVKMEFEFAQQGKVIKTFTGAGPDGPTVSIVIPFHLLGADQKVTPEFVDELGDLRQYVERRADWIESLPWAKQPLPKRYAFVNNCSGYSEQRAGQYGVRTSDKAVMLAECRTLHQIGVNGFRDASEFLAEMVRNGEGIGSEFRRIMLTWGGIGYPVIQWRKNNPPPPPGAGCPYYPGKDFNAIMTTQAKKAMDELVRPNSAVEEYWLLTVDEIGTVFDHAPEGKAHQGCCPNCRKAFHEYLQGFGLTLNDFGAKSWDDIRSTRGYWAKTYEEQQKEAAEAKARKQKGDVKTQPTQDVKPKHQLSERGWNLLAYYSGRFNNDASAKLFTPLREVFSGENARKREALQRGDTNSPAARQPWVYSYALRDSTFLMHGHSLDFFDFYRFADNGFMYETSNSDPRVWEWDSYLCDVGRILQWKLDKRFGIYIKPHRGAPIQRALTAASRQVKVIYWYTYGPDWSKGDNFAGKEYLLSACSRVARLLAGAEDVTYDAQWAWPAEAAVVRPRTSEIWGNNTSNGKWVFQALTHAHIPVDALDEGFLMSEDLARYKIIYISGAFIQKAVAAKLAHWVEQGGVLYTSGGGLARDEANEPLDAFQAVLGIKSRGEMDLWSQFPGYTASGLGGPKKLKDPPEGAKVTGRKTLTGTFDLAVGREILNPVANAEVLATYADGGAAAIRHPHGKGCVYVVGFYAGIEYATDVMKAEYDMSTDFSADKRSFVAAPALAAGVRPIVDASHPLVEGVLLQNPQSGKQAAILMNWAYAAGRGLAPQSNLTVRVHTAIPVTAVKSLATGENLRPEKVEGGFKVLLPGIQEGDILLLETAKL